MPGYERLVDGMVIDMAKVPAASVNILAEVSATGIQTATFRCEGPVPYLILEREKARGRAPTWRKQRSRPFTVFGDDPGVVFGWNPVDGPHTITARLYPTADFSGPPLEGSRLRFTVVNADAGR